MLISSVAGVRAAAVQKQQKRQENNLKNHNYIRYTTVYTSVRALKSRGLDNTSRILHITFTGQGKKMHQAASITPENNGLGLNEAKQGGEGCVGYEMPASWRRYEHLDPKDTGVENLKTERIDARSFMPFWEHDNPKGGYKFLIHKKADYPNGFLHLNDGKMPESAFYSANVGETLETVARKLNLQESELSYVIQSKPDRGFSRYCILEPTSVKGEIERLSDTVLGEVKRIPYALFKVSAANPEYNKLKGEPHYFYYVPALAGCSKPYSYDKWGNSCFDAEIINSDGMRALTKIIHSQMNTAEFDYYDPANVILHDRISHPYVNYVSRMSSDGDTSVNGVKYHLVEHNPGRNYQGITGDPFKMLTIVADPSDAKVIKGLPYYPILAKAQQYGIYSDALSPREKQIAWAVLEPVLKPYRDGAGTYNVIKTGLAAARINHENISAGTVSYNYAKEMGSSDMYDAAKFLTDDFAQIPTKNVLNGSTPANLKLDDPTVLFGEPEAAINKSIAGFTAFKYDGTNIEEVVAAREKNAKWLSNLIFEAGEKGQDALNELFFSKTQIKDGHGVIGYISRIKDGDILDFSWGRPDEQKGFPITMKGFLKFLKDPSVPAEDKLRYKVIIGAGPWNKNNPDYIDMIKDLDEIQKLEGGIYKYNAMIINGRTPNRIVGCATYGSFTSRREMCGITPLECKAAGVPYAATKTGGPVDYTNPSNGFLTKNPVEENPQKFGLTWENSPQEIDRARVERSSDEMVDIFKAKVELYTKNRQAYIAMCKKNIEEKIDWHENAEYNHGKSANRRYLDDIFGVNEGFESRNKKPMQRIMGAFEEFKDDMEVLIERSGKSKPAKAVMIILGGLVFITGIYFIMKPKKLLVSKNKIDKAA